MDRNNKRTNARKNPGIKGRRPDHANSRKMTAVVNNEKWNKLTPEEKAARNPKKAKKYLPV